jgi:hypothetical protein
MTGKNKNSLAKKSRKGSAEYIISCRNGMPYLSRHSRTTVEVSTGQKRGILILVSLAAAWSVLPEVIRRSWADTDGFPGFIAENTDRCKRNEPIILIRSGAFAQPSIRAVSTAAGEITLSYTDGNTLRYLSIFIQTPGKGGSFSFKEAANSTTAKEVTFTGLASGKSPVLYCVFSDTPIAQSGRILASQTIVVMIK